MDDSARIIAVVEILIRDQKTDDLHTIIENIEMEIIRQRGYRDGRSAGTWVFDQGSTPEGIRAVVRGIEDGDPMILDQLPSPRLNGEFADDPTWEDVLKEESIRYDSSLDIDGRQSLLDEYEMAFQQGVEDEITQYASDFRC